MQQNVIQVRNQPRLALREDPQRSLEAVVVPLQLPLARPEDREIPVAPELHRRPQHKHAEQDPPPRRLPQLKRRHSPAVHAQHNKLSALRPLPVDKVAFAEMVGHHGAKEPDPQYDLKD